jgi:YbbR domain-containing protein
MSKSGYKLISLITALFLWYYVTSTVRTISFLVPYELQGVPQDRILISSPREQIRVRISGPSFMLSSIQGSFPIFRVKVPKDLRQDRYVATLREKDLALPSAVQVLSIEPKEIELRFDQRISKMVPVEVPHMGTLDPDLILSSTSVNPEKVIVEGPQNELSKLKLIETYPLDLRELQASVATDLAIRTSSNFVKPLVETVLVHVKIEPVISEKTFSSVPVINKNLEEGVAVAFSPPTVSLSVSGPIKVVRELNEDSLKAFVDLKTAMGSPQVLEPSFNIPRGLAVKDLSHKKINARFSLDQKVQTPSPTVKSLTTP